MIASDIFNDEFFCELSQTERLLWIGIIAQCADDQGRLQDKPHMINSRIFPDDNLPTEIIMAGLDKFSKTGKIVRYEIGDKRLIQIIKWWIYQTPGWASPSKYPAPDKWVDRVKVHVSGSVKVITRNWNMSGGFQDSDNQVTNVVGNIDECTLNDCDVKGDDDVKGEIESEGDNQPQYCANPKTGEYEQKEPYHYEPADELFCDDIFLQVTGFYPAIESAALVRKTILLIAEKNHTKDKAKIAGILRPFYLDWIGRKNKHGGHYSKTKIEWLTEWAATGEIPKANDGKPPDTFKQQSPEEIVRLKAELRKGKK